MKCEDRIKIIVNWLKNYCKTIKKQPAKLIIGVSGGIDSAVASTLCAQTGLETIAISMPIKQNKEQHNLSLLHLEWLRKSFDNVKTEVIELDNIFTAFKNTIKEFLNYIIRYQTSYVSKPYLDFCEGLMHIQDTNIVYFVNYFIVRLRCMLVESP